MDLTPFVEVLRRGGIVACPTETQVGLLADALSEAAVALLVTLKRRGDAPIALLLPDEQAVALVAEDVPEHARTLMRVYWPGPLTLVLRARPGLPHAIAADGSVGVRVPGESPALALVRAFGGPLTATSCNPSGEPAANDDAEARRYFGESVAYVPGAGRHARPSTLVDARALPMRVLRAGAITLSTELLGPTP